MGCSGHEKEIGRQVRSGGGQLPRGASFRAMVFRTTVVVRLGGGRSVKYGGCVFPPLRPRIQMRQESFIGTFGQWSFPKGGSLGAGEARATDEGEREVLGVVESVHLVIGGSLAPGCAG